MTCTSFHVDTERTWRGGEQQVLYLARGLQAAGHRAIVVCQPRSPLLKAAQEASLETVAIRMLGEADPVASFRLATLGRRVQAHLIHAHTSCAHTLGIVARSMGCRASLIVARRVDFPIRSRWKYGNSVNRFIAVSEAVRRVLEQGGVPRDRIAVVHDGVDLGRIASAPQHDYRAEFGLNRSHILIGNAAHMADHKGQRFLIDAMPLVLQRHPEARLLIVGTGELWNSLTAQARRLHVEHAVIFAGFRTDVPSILKGLDVFVISSHLEGLCSSLLDALAAGCPVVATSAGGIPEVVEDKHNGLLVPARDPQALANGICHLIEDRSLAARLAHHGRLTVEQRFSVKRMVDGTLAVYRSVLKAATTKESP